MMKLSTMLLLLLVLLVIYINICNSLIINSLIYKNILKNKQYLNKNENNNRIILMAVPNRGPPQRGMRPAKEQPPINEFIKADRVRLIVPATKNSDITNNNNVEDDEDDEEEEDDDDEDDEDEEDDNDNDEDDDERTEIMHGIVSLSEALKIADSYDLDLVMINDKGDPPVCKVIDYGKYKYSQEKKKKENMKKQIKTEIKEVKMSYKIDQHDFDVRMRAVQKFLGEGDRVKVVVQFKGREMQHKDLGRELLMKIYQPIENVAVMESSPKMEGRAITMLVGPKKTV